MRVALHNNPMVDQADIICLCLQNNSILHTNRKICAEKAGATMKYFLILDPPMVQKVWYWMNVWYKHSRNIYPPPSRVSIESITMERVDLYWRVPFPGEKI